MRDPQRPSGVRRAGAWLVPIVALLVAVLPVVAQQRRAPVGPITVVVGSGAGATPDVLMRRMAKILNEQKLVSNPIVVENRTGGAWMTAANYVLGRRANENILFGVVPTIFTTPIVQGLPNTYDRLTPLSYLVKIDLVICVLPSSPDRTLTALVNRARQRERSVSAAGANVGSTDQMVVSQLERVGGIRLNYVPFDGGTGVLQAFLGRNVDMIVLALDEAVPLLRSGRVRALAVLSETRRTEPELDDIATAREQGIDLVWGQDFGVAAPPGLAPAVAAWWEDRFAAMVQTTAWKEMTAQAYLRTSFTRGAETRQRMGELHQSYLNVLRAVGQAKR